MTRWDILRQSLCILWVPIGVPLPNHIEEAWACKRPDELFADIIKGLIAKVKGDSSNFDPARIEDVIVGCAMPEAEQGMNMARVCTLLAGLPVSVPGMTINRFCSSGLQSIALAADRVAAGHGDCFIAGGVESMTMVPMMGHKPVGSHKITTEYPEIYMNMGLTAEKVATQFEVSREDQDRFSYESHKKALKAQDQGDFAQEILPVTASFNVPSENPGQTQKKDVVFAKDEGPRADTSLEKLSQLRTVFFKRRNCDCREFFPGV